MSKKKSSISFRSIEPPFRFQLLLFPPLISLQGSTPKLYGKMKKPVYYKAQSTGEIKNQFLQYSSSSLRKNFFQNLLTDEQFQPIVLNEFYFIRNLCIRLIRHMFSTVCVGREIQRSSHWPLHADGLSMF